MAAVALGDRGAMGSVNCEDQQNHELCQRQNIHMFPTLIFYRNKHPTVYSKSRAEANIVQFVIDQSADPVKMVETGDQAEFYLHQHSHLIHHVSVLAFLAPPTQNPADHHVEHETSVFRQLAEELRIEGYSFAASVKPEVAKHFRVEKFPTLLAFKNDDVADPQQAYSGAWDTQHLLHWLKSESFPAIGIIDGENFQHFARRGLPIAYLFVDPGQPHKQTSIDALKPLAKTKRLRETVSMAMVDGIKFEQHAKSLGVTTLPSLLLQDIRTRRKWKTEDFESSKLQTFFDDWAHNKLAPYVVSQPEPAVNRKAVKVLVGHNFVETVNDEKLNVLVNLFAPWCGHCKSLHPKYERMALTFADQPDILIASMDATKNDAGDLQIQAYPTILFYPAGSSHKTPQMYRGPPDAQNLAAFINALRFESLLSFGFGLKLVVNFMFVAQKTGGQSASASGLRPPSSCSQRRTGGRR
jgi:protein disulfide-isomerase A1